MVRASLNNVKKMAGCGGGGGGGGELVGWGVYEQGAVLMHLKNSSYSV